MKKKNMDAARVYVITRWQIYVVWKEICPLMGPAGLPKQLAELSITPLCRFRNTLIESNHALLSYTIWVCDISSHMHAPENIL